MKLQCLSAVIKAKEDNVIIYNIHVYQNVQFINSQVKIKLIEDELI